MKKILFVTLGHLSGGEFTIAFEFSRRLSKDNYNVCFLTSEKGKRHLEETGISHTVLYQSHSNSLVDDDKFFNKKIADELIHEFKPDLIIASDVYTLWYSYSWSGLTLEGLKEYKVPIGSFDSYEFSSTDYIQDFYGGYKAVLPHYIDDCDFIIRYCPINKARENTKKIKYTYLYELPAALSDNDIQEFNCLFKPNRNEKVIFMANSNWESLNINRFPALSNLSEWIPKIIMRYIEEIEEEISIIHVGPNRWNSDVKKSNIKYYHYEFLKPNIYDQYLLQSDLLITTNMISSTLAKAVYSSIPSLVLYNDKLVNFENMGTQLKAMPLWYQEMAADVKIAYPFKLFPFGWHKFLNAVLDNNEYLGTFMMTSIFQMNKAVSKIKKYLLDENLKKEYIERQKEYIRKIMLLPSSDQVLDSIINLL